LPFKILYVLPISLNGAGTVDVHLAQLEFTIMGFCENAVELSRLRREGVC
jgi:hypothetical protein